MDGVNRGFDAAKLTLERRDDGWQLVFHRGRLRLQDIADRDLVVGRVRSRVDEGSVIVGSVPKPGSEIASPGRRPGLMVEMAACLKGDLPMQRLVSTATLPMAVGKAFFEYEGIYEASKQLDVDGVELVFLPEWDQRWAPVTPTSADWRTTPKATPLEIADMCLSLSISVPVVHLNRDIGTRLCSPDREDVLRGQNVLSENLAAASTLNSEIGVLHLWDTYAESIDTDKLFERVTEV